MQIIVTIKWISNLKSISIKVIISLISLRKRFMQKKKKSGANIHRANRQAIKWTKDMKGSVSYQIPTKRSNNLAKLSLSLPVIIVILMTIF